MLITPELVADVARVTLARTMSPSVPSRESATTARKPSWKLNFTRLPRPPTRFDKRATGSILRSASQRDAQTVRATLRKLHEDLDRVLPEGIKDVMLNEMLHAPKLVPALVTEGRALAHLLEAARAWRRSRQITPPHVGSLAVVTATAGGLADAVRLAEALELSLGIEVERRRQMTDWDQLLEGALTAQTSGVPPVARWLATRAVGLALGPAELVLMEAILAGEGKPIPLAVGPTWWQNPKRALARWTAVFNEALAAKPRRGARSSRRGPKP